MKGIARLVVAVALLCIVPGSTLAHVKNDETQFPDIDFSSARFDIVLLVAVGIIPETPVFEPDKPLTRYELATWAALASGIGKRAEFPDTDGLAQSTLESGLMSSLDGEATLDEIDQVLFGGILEVDQPARVPSKAEAASLISDNLTTPVQGGSLLARQDMTEGPVGEITAVVSRPTPDGEDASYITIGETTIPAYPHVRVAGGPTDLPLWEGTTVARTIVQDLGELQVWSYLEAAPFEAIPSPSAAAVAEQVRGSDEDEGNSRFLFYSLVAAASALAILVFASGRRRDKP